MHETGRHRLTSWKEIAAHLGRDVRTVLRWEKERGLPIHRVPGVTGRVVFAYTDELDAWSRGESELAPAADPAPTAEVGTNAGTAVSGRRWLRPAVLAIGCAAVALIVGSGWMWLRRRPSMDIAQVTMTDSGQCERERSGSNHDGLLRVVCGLRHSVMLRTG